MDVQWILGVVHIHHYIRNRSSIINSMLSKCRLALFLTCLFYAKSTERRTNDIWKCYHHETWHLYLLMKLFVMFMQLYQLGWYFLIIWYAQNTKIIWCFSKWQNKKKMLPLYLAALAAAYPPVMTKDWQVITMQSPAT